MGHLRIRFTFSCISFDVSSRDGKDHQVELYFDQTAEVAVNNVEEIVDWSHVEPVQGLKHVMRIGTVEQKVLDKSGDCDAINWGYAYIAVDPVATEESLETVIGYSAIEEYGIYEQKNHASLSTNFHFCDSSEFILPVFTLSFLSLPYHNSPRSHV